MAIDMSMKVLVVDDFATMRRIIKGVLKQLGFTNIIEAEDGTNALEELKKENVGLIDLGDSGKIDRAISVFRKEMGKKIRIKDSQNTESLRELYNLVIEPIRKELKDIKDIFISPDGNLNLIPFEVLQRPDGRFLIEDYTFNYLAAGRDITVGLHVRFAHL